MQPGGQKPSERPLGLGIRHPSRPKLSRSDTSLSPSPASYSLAPANQQPQCGLPARTSSRGRPEAVPTRPRQADRRGEARHRHRCRTSTLFPPLPEVSTSPPTEGGRSCRAYHPSHSRHSRVCARHGPNRGRHGSPARGAPLPDPWQRRCRQPRHKRRPVEERLPSWALGRDGYSSFKLPKTSLSNQFSPAHNWVWGPPIDRSSSMALSLGCPPSEPCIASRSNARPNYACRQIYRSWDRGAVGAGPP